MSKSKYQCYQCQKEYEKYPSLVTGKYHFCSRNCKSIFQQNSLLGENNPNFGNRWTDIQKEKQRQYAIKQMEDPQQRFLVGKANRGKKLSFEIRQKMSDSWKLKNRKGTPHTKKSKLLIGKKSKEKFTLEYKSKYRQKMEEIGKWLPLDQKEDKEIYYLQSNWIAKMFDIIDIKLFSEKGVWHFKNNKTGLVRDHKYSRKSGFKNKVFSELLRHPANCQLITHSANVSNAQKRNGLLEDIITLEELFFAIENYNGIWIEQEMCLKLIIDYRNGLRWKR